MKRRNDEKYDKLVDKYRESKEDKEEMSQSWGEKQGVQKDIMIQVIECKDLEFGVCIFEFEF